ncbi:antibiotic biosynthesis monooxygenase [Neobacillus sp. WH10]|uniref:antibiotic biosynthesis monooxygenase family protein n=1 Tax=Neobacillus sp. WH10 TaxID=3047873 RepID=UPI0024C1D07E|nr:antibiotic biosynthesis monooxygenase [Neobacillus sp. WH10]WHY78911.1 antibiotic biosynthesis monooxygenase [Neobacillus sp. WH10]
MHVYLTTGTFDFLKRIESKYPNEVMVTMVNENGALLLHETIGGTAFKEPRRYEVLESIGEIQKEGFAVMNNIPVKDEGRPLFEHQFKNQVQNIENEPGLIAFRLLRPLSSNTYVILTVWENEAYHQKWKKSDTFFEADKIKGTSINTQQNIFASAPYVSKYSITK